MNLTAARSIKLGEMSLRYCNIKSAVKSVSLCKDTGKVVIEIEDRKRACCECYQMKFTVEEILVLGFAKVKAFGKGGFLCPDEVEKDLLLEMARKFRMRPRKEQERILQQHQPRQ